MENITRQKTVSLQEIKGEKIEKEERKETRRKEVEIEKSKWK